MTHPREGAPLEPPGAAEVSCRYRQLVVDKVSDELDRAILSQAQAAVAHSSMTARSWLRWLLPCGFAASAVLAGVFMFDATRTPPQAPASSSVPVAAQESLPPSAPATGQPAPIADTLRAAPSVSERAAAASPAAPRHSSASETPPRKDLESSRRAPEVIAAPQQVVPQIVAPSPGSSLSASGTPHAPPALPEQHEPAASTAEAPAVNTDAEPETAFEGLEALRATSTTLSPAKRAQAEDRLEDIRYLRQTGRKRAADVAWRRFMKDFPDYPVAADDLARSQDQ